MKDTSDFKRCSCGATWASRDAFVRDPDIQPIGMTFLPGEDNSQLYYFFNHLGCKSTLAIDAEDFIDLITEPIPANVLAGEEECPGRCTKMGELETCDNDCRNAPFRRLLIDEIQKKSI